MHALNRHGRVGSRGKVGAAGDNAAMERFFALLQKNVLDRPFWATRDKLRIAVVLDRAGLPLPPSASPSREADPHRVRDHDELRRDPRGMKPHHHLSMRESRRRLQHEVQ